MGDLDEKARRAAEEFEAKARLVGLVGSSAARTWQLAAAFKAFAEEAREAGADQEWKAVIRFLRSREYIEAADRIERGDHEEFLRGGGQG